MASLRGFILITSAVVATFALALTILPQYWTSSRDTTYCYDSVTNTTLANEQQTPNCFSVSRAGTFTRVFYEGSEGHLPDVQVQAGHVIPGLWDGHGHLMQYGELLQSVNLFGAKSLDDAVARVKQYAKVHPGAGTSKEWIRGTGWDQATFGRYPVAADLEADHTLKGKFIMLDRVDVHCVWISRAILDLLPSNLPEIPGGEIITNPGPGVFCDNAMDLVLQYWPKPSKMKKAQFVKAAMKELNKVGLVGMHDAGVTSEDMQLYKEMANTNSWTVRVYAMLECEKRNTFCPQGANPPTREDGLLSSRSVKLFADGALGSWGSAMLEPYTDRPSTTGSLLVNASTLTSLAHSWAGEGYQVNIHAIGDLANRLAIDAMEDVYRVLCPHQSAKVCQSRLRFRIEHAQIIHPDDQRRMHDFGIIPSIQPTHATSDFSYAEDRLGRKRTRKEAYRMRSLLDLNPVLGSDFPVEPPNPFEGLFAAVTRKNPRTGLGKDGSEKGWYAEERLNLSQAVKGFTLAPAHAAFMDGRAGTIQPGAFADWVVLDRALESLEINDLRRVEPRSTWVKGKQVYRRK